LPGEKSASIKLYEIELELNNGLKKINPPGNLQFEDIKEVNSSFSRHLFIFFDWLFMISLNWLQPFKGF
jgi:hypothetical protein